MHAPQVYGTWFVRLSVHLSVRLSVCLSVHLHTNLTFDVGTVAIMVGTNNISVAS